MSGTLERAARAVAGKFAVDWDKASVEQKQSAADVAIAVLMAVRGVDGHGIEVNYWSERVVDAILSEENK